MVLRDPAASGYDGRGLVTVHPEVVATIPGFDEELLSVLGDQEVSIENSVAFRRGIAYFANSGGLVQGWDLRGVLGGGDEVRRVFRFWVGDDVDASIVIDGQGFLYVAAQYQRFNERSREVGQLMKLDPRRPDDPVVWSIDAREVGFEGAGGSWSTPAVYGNVIFFSTAAGRVLEVERGSGRVVHELRVGSPSIASPVVVDGVLMLGDCIGDLYAWDVSDPTVEPPLLWKMRLDGCIESTPAVWRGGSTWGHARVSCTASPTPRRPGGPTAFGDAATVRGCRGSRSDTGPSSRRPTRTPRRRWTGTR